MCYARLGLLLDMGYVRYLIILCKVWTAVRIWDRWREIVYLMLGGTAVRLWDTWRELCMLMHG